MALANSGSRLKGNRAGASLFLGDTVLHKVGSGAVSAVRTYAGAGGVSVAERVGSTGSAAVLVWLFADVNGTVDTQTVAGTGVTTRQYRDPFGVPLGGASGVWGDGNGFLNKPATTTTGLSSLGARSYDPVLGAFASPDPLLNTADPRHANAYAYGYNSPVAYSDAAGTRPIGTYDYADGTAPSTGGKYVPKQAAASNSMGCALSSYAAACQAPGATSGSGSAHSSRGGQAPESGGNSAASWVRWSSPSVVSPSSEHLYANSSDGTWTDKPGRLGAHWGIPTKDVKHAIEDFKGTHKVRTSTGKLRNPDVEIEIETGDVRVQGGDGEVIGNLDENLNLSVNPAPALPTVDWGGIVAGVGIVIVFIGAAVYSPLQAAIG